MRYLLAIATTLSLLQPALAGDRKTCKHHAPGEDIYKHYKGTIGAHAVLLDLRYGYCGSSNYGGSYIHDLTDGTTTRLMIGEPASFAHDVELTATVSNISDDWWNAVENEPEWHFRINGDNLKGTWTSADKKVSLDIDLAEDKTASPFEVITFSDSAKTMKPGKPMHTAYYDFVGVTAIPASSPVNKSILQFTHGSALGALNMEELPSVLAQKDYITFKTAYESLPSDTANPVWHISENYYATLVFPVYNNNKIVSLECIFHSNEFEHTCVNIDLSSNKQFTLNTVFGSNIRKADAILKEEYKKHYAERLSVDSVAATENFAITNGGLIFYYTYYRGYQAEKSLYIPYSKLSALLSKDFKKRMSL